MHRDSSTGMSFCSSRGSGGGGRLVHLENVFGSGGYERPAAGDHLENHHSQGIDIRSFVEGQKLGLFRRGIVGSAEKNTAPGDARLPEHPGHTEIGEVRLTVLVQENVARFDVPV